MAGIKKVLSIILGWGLVAGAAAHLAAAQVIHHPRPNSPLAERVDWAFQEAEKAGFAKGFWIGFSIRRLMGEHSYTASHKNRGQSYFLRNLLGRIVRKK
jgi:hypothetical protein